MRTVAIDMRMVRSSGIGTILAHVVPALINRRPDWRFKLIGSPAILGCFDWSSSPNVELVAFEKPIYSLSEQLLWPSAALRGADLLWSPNYNIPLFWRGPLLLTVNDCTHLALPDAFRGPVKRIYANVMFRFARWRANAIVYISKFTASDFVARLGAPKAAQSVVYCGVDADWFNIEPGPSLRLRPYILFVGNVKPHKNLIRLLQAFDKIKNDIPHDLVIVGKREGFLTGDDAVQAMVTEFAGRVDFTGYIEDKMLRRYFAQANALILPSLYEGFGLPPIEAMAAGCPVIVSRSASLPEVCADAAVYCDALDVSDIAAAIMRLVADEDLCREMRRRGALRARYFNWESSIDGYYNAISKLLNCKA
jgi:glycosyltransferase involved in cell wall biosynthesis